jgi:hypothetical protein
VAVRYWQRSGVKPELDDLSVILILDVKGGYTHPPVLGKRGCKVLKTKSGSSKKRGKRVQEAAKHWSERGWRKLKT